MRRTQRCTAADAEAEAEGERVVAGETMELQLQTALRHLRAASRELSKAAGAGDVYMGTPATTLMQRWLFDDSARQYAARAARRIRAARRCDAVRKAIPSRTARQLDSGALRIDDIVRCADIVSDAMQLVTALRRGGV